MFINRLAAAISTSLQYGLMPAFTHENGLRQRLPFTLLTKYVMTLLFLLLLSVTSFFANLNEIVQAARQPQKFAVIENFFISLYKGTSNKLIWQYRVKNEIVKY
jgi:hypothetical protein